MTSRTNVIRATAVVQRANLPALLGQVINPAGVGHKSSMPLLAWAVACLLLPMSGLAQTNENIVRVLNELDDDLKLLLGMRRLPDGTYAKLTRRQVENVGTVLQRRLGYLEVTQPDLTPEERQRRQALLESLCDGLIDASKPLDLAPTGHYTLDATGIHAWYRKPRRPRTGPADQGDDGPSPDGPPGDSDDGPPISRDPEARHGKKTAKGGGQEWFYGYNIYPMVRVGLPGGHVDLPHLVERFRVRPASGDEPTDTLPMIRAMHVGPYPVRELLTDRAWSYSRPETGPTSSVHSASRRWSTCTRTTTGPVITRACASLLPGRTAPGCPTSSSTSGGPHAWCCP